MMCDKCNVSESGESCFSCGDSRKDIIDFELVEIKSWPDQFQAVLDGYKKHEVRKFDREYKFGQHVILQEWNPETEKYTGRWAQVVIRNITMPGTFGLPSDIGVFSFGVIARADAPTFA